MQTQEMSLNHKEAVHLIRVGRYEEAWRLLAEIDAVRPDVKNVLYPMAICGEKLGYVEKTLAICERLISLHDHEQARLIKARVELQTVYPEAEEIDDDTMQTGEEASAGEEALTPPEKAPVSDDSDGKPRRRKPTWLMLLIALVAAAATAVLIHTFMLGS